MIEIIKWKISEDLETSTYPGLVNFIKKSLHANYKSSKNILPGTTVKCMRNVVDIIVQGWIEDIGISVIFACPKGQHNIYLGFAVITNDRSPTVLFSYIKRDFRSGFNVDDYAGVRRGIFNAIDSRWNYVIENRTVRKEATDENPRIHKAFFKRFR